MTNELEIEKQIKEAFAFFLERGFSHRYFYEKGGDSSCVYIHRFQKGKDFFDLREVSGGDEINFVVYADGAYQFPSLKTLYKAQHTAFFWKHFFKKPTKEERRAFLYGLLLDGIETKTEFFGIKL